MEYNKRDYAALLIRCMSLWERVTAKTEHITYLPMPKKLIGILLLMVSYTYASGTCVFPSLGSGTSCNDPLPLCSNVSSTLPDQSIFDTFPSLCATGSLENPVWYQFIACEPTVTIEIIPGTCSLAGIGGTGIQGTINEDCNAASSLDCNDNPNTDPFILTSSSFIVGNTYFLVLDGFGTSICDYDINIIQGISTLEVGPGNGVNEITASGFETCNEEGDEFSFCVNDCFATSDDCVLPTLLNSNLFCYEWTFDPPIVNITSSNPNLSCITVEFLQEGTTTVSVERFINPVLEACSTGACVDPNPIDVTVNFLDTLINPKTIICPGDQVDICGNPVGIDGVYECLDDVNCVLTIDTIEFAIPDLQDLGVMFLCPSECFTFQGVDYCDRDVFVVTDTADCGISYQFSLEDGFINIQEPTYPILDCSGTCPFVNMAVTTTYEEQLSYCFIDPDGLKISVDVFTEVCIPGEYSFTVFHPSFPNTCLETINFTIEMDDIPPAFDLQAGVLTCSEKEADLNFIEIDDIVDFEWSGPGIQDATSINAFATLPGMYYFEGVGSNGCIGIDSIEVMEDLIPADIDIDFDNLTCDVAMTTLTIITDDIEIDSVIWTGIGDFISRELQPGIVDTGTYIANIFASNGCDYTEIIKILGSFEAPEFDISQADFWVCDTESINLSSIINFGDDVTYRWFTEDGEILSDETESEITVGSIATYFLEVRDGLNGCTDVDTFSVMTDPNIPSDVEIIVTQPSCFGIDDGMIEILGVSGGTEPFTFMLNGFATTEFVITDLEPGTYDFTLIDNNECTLERTYELVYPDELLAELDGPETAIYNEFITITTIYNDTLIDVDVINWFNSAGEFLGIGDELSYQFQMTETFTMEMVDVNGCSITRTITIRSDEDFDYYVPNIFSPDNNGVNDFFRIYSQNAPGEIQSFNIYDRWGNRVYQLNGTVSLPNDDDTWGWDGRANGRNVATGVYVFHAVVETLGVQKELKGSITLVR